MKRRHTVRRALIWTAASFFGLLALLVALGAVVGSGTAKDTTATPDALVATPPSVATPTPSADGLPAPASYVMPTDCQGLHRALAAFIATANGKAASYSHITDPRAAAAFVSAHTILTDAYETGALYRAVDSALRSARSRATMLAKARLDPRLLGPAAVRFCKQDGLFEQAVSAATKVGESSALLTSRAQDVPWYPAGFDEVTDGIALDFLQHPACPAYTGCFQARVVVRQACSNLYVEIATLDSSRNKVGYSNDVLVSLQPGERGLLTFAATNDNVTNAEFSKANCS